MHIFSVNQLQLTQKTKGGQNTLEQKGMFQTSANVGVLPAGYYKLRTTFLKALPLSSKFSNKLKLAEAGDNNTTSPFSAA